MATNPMQRKARNSFLLGMFITLLITGAIIALLIMQLMNKIKKEKEELSLMTNAYVLKQDVSSGQVITSDMFEKKSVNKDLVPSNATSDLSIIENYSLQDKVVAGKAGVKAPHAPLHTVSRSVNNVISFVFICFLVLVNKKY